ncbi:MAG: AI-2E family transporter [Bacteroidaceae bacterium]|nr:AI-2E family transporter [Bacteroidaceae bacterium]
MKQNEVTLGRFLRILLIIATLTITYFVLDSLSGILLPFAVAWLLAYFINPLVNFIQNRLRFKFRLLSTIVALVLIGAVVYGILLLIVPSIISELNLLKDFIIAFLNNNLMNATIPEPVINFFKEIFNDKDVADVVKSVGSGDFVPILAERFQGVVTGTFNAVSQLFAMSITLLYLFFILLDFERVSRGWKPYVPKKWRGIVGKLWGDLVGGMNQYFRGQALVALCVGVLYSIGLSIIDFPVAIAFGLFIGVLNLVPYLQLVSVVPMVLLAVLKAASTGGDFWLIMLSACAVLLVVQIIQDLLLVPYIMGKRMNLHPAVILLSLSIWGKLLGLLGMIVALPLTTILLAYLKRYHEIAEYSKSDEEQILKKAINSANVAQDKEK